MKVLIPRLSGFCPGVKAAEKRIFSELEANPGKPHSVLGMMINNRKYIRYLKENEVGTVRDAENLDRGSTLFIRTHGIDRALQEELQDDYELIDLTCRNVKKVQEIIREHSDSGAAVIITGKKSHPETIGLKSYACKAAVVENEEELDELLDNFNCDGAAEIFITSQTTGSRELYESAIEKTSARFPDAKISTFNSICPVTEMKEKEAVSLQKQADISFVIGDPLSSNANKLFSCLSTAETPAYFIQDVNELKSLNLALGSYECALVVSSASTPKFAEDEVVNYLESLPSRGWR